VPVESNENVLIGTVGYALLGNHSVGPVLLPLLRILDWPEGVTVDELNWGPIAVVQQFEAMETPYSRVVLLVAIERPGREIGEISIFQWKGGLPDEKQIQACIGDATTGVISSDNLLVIGEYFNIWPNDVFLVDVEPGPELSGENFTTEFGVKVPIILQTIQRIGIEGLGDIEDVELLKGDALFENV